jgi:glycosyltransferase involved in cell wall biosynthesis
MKEFLSVVIPSLGGDLDQTLVALNSGTIIPDEIIISLPDSSCIVKNCNVYPNIRIIYTGQYGQVQQRIYGFKHSRFDYILQLDDDIIVDERCLEYLIKAIRTMKEKGAVSPYWYDIDNKPLACEEKTGWGMIFYYWIINGSTGYASGNITLAGTNFDAHPNYANISLTRVDWQPGGCILHNKEDTILENYYPYNGKAYSEDLIHSFLLKKSSISLFVVNRAKCSTKPSPHLKSTNEMYRDFKARLYFTKMANLSIVRMCLHYIFYIANSKIRKKA